MWPHQPHTWLPDVSPAIAACLRLCATMNSTCTWRSSCCPPPGCRLSSAVSGGASAAAAVPVLWPRSRPLAAATAMAASSATGASAVVAATAPAAGVSPAAAVALPAAARAAGASAASGADGSGTPAPGAFASAAAASASRWAVMTRRKSAFIGWGVDSSMQLLASSRSCVVSSRYMPSFSHSCALRWCSATRYCCRHRTAASHTRAPTAARVLAIQESMPVPCVCSHADAMRGTKKSE